MESWTNRKIKKIWVWTHVDCFFDGYGSYESNLVPLKNKKCKNFSLKTVADPSW